MSIPDEESVVHDVIDDITTIAGMAYFCSTRKKDCHTCTQGLDKKTLSNVTDKE